MAIIYSYPLTTNILATDVIVGTTTTLAGGRPRNQTKSFEIGDLATYFASVIAPPGTYVPYNGATGPVNLGAYDLTLNGATIGRGGGQVYSNIVFGLSSLLNNTTGQNNTYLGFSSGYYNTTGSYNSAIGAFASQFTTTGNYNIAIGNTALYTNTAGSYNLAIGSGALFSNTTGSNNIAIGYSTQVLNPTDVNSIIIGTSATGAGSNTVVLGNTSITTTRLRGNVQGGAFIKDGGTNLQYLMADGTVSTAAGITSLNGLTTNTQAFSIGTTGTNFNINSVGSTHTFNLPDASITARGVVTIGNQAFSGLKNFTDNIIVNGININKGSNNGTNIAIGAEALDNTVGNQNTVIGFEAASNNDVVSLATSFNTVLGYQAYSNGQANNNTAIGWQSLFSSAANNNSALGYSSGLLITTGFQNTFIGAFAGGFAGQKIDATNSTAIGYQTITTKNNQVVLGNSSVNETVIRGTTLVDGGVFNAVDSLIVGGPTKSTQYKLSTLNTAPASATAAGTLGEIRVTAAFIYVCIATNTWVRAALTTW